MSDKVLCVDDEQNVLAGYQRTLRKQFVIETATGGEVALHMIERCGPYAVVVADMRMPGMDGVQLLAGVRRRAPDTVRIMLTGNADQHTAVQAVNEGRIFRFLNKPCSPEELAAVLRAAVEHHRLVRAERELLEETLNGSVTLLTDVLSLIEPASFGRGQKLRNHMRSFAVALELPSRWELELGAMLSPLGGVTLPPELALKVRRGVTLGPKEQDLVRRIPELGANLIQRIPRLQTVAHIVRYQAKHFDGSGFPADAVFGQAIPLGSRMLKVLEDLDELEAQGLTRSKALGLMCQREGRYDPDLLAAAHRCFAEAAAPPIPTPGDECALNLPALTTGSLLLEDVVTHEGLLIVTAHTLLSEPLLERLRNFSATHGVREPIRVRRLPKQSRPGPA